MPRVRSGSPCSWKEVFPWPNRDSPISRHCNLGWSEPFDFAARQVRLTVERTPDYFPIYTVGGRWLHRGELWTDWCGGFHAGMMWLIANRTGESWWRQTAEHYSGLLEHRQHDRNVHDLGFIFLNTYLPWFRSTGDERLQAVLITAGRTLALRFNPRGKYLCSFIGPESLFIDIMMNVPLIFHAAREAGDRDLHVLAAAHCRTTETTLVRPDGSTAHEGIFDPETGQFLRESTHQGLRPDSAWTRGLAWSLYGFSKVFFLHSGSGRPGGRAAERRVLSRALPREPGSPLGF